MPLDWLSLSAAALIAGVALVYFLVAFGVRRGELVWSGRYPRMLPPHLRRRSLGYAVLLVLAGWVVAAYGGAIDLSPVREEWMRSAGFVATVILAISAVHHLFKGSRWERLLFLPIVVFGALLAGWLTFG